MSEDRQIQSMIAFIEREAQEKAEELDAAAQEEYDVEKMRLVEAEKAKIRTNTEKKKKQVEVERRVARANHSKDQRQRLMEERALILETLEKSIEDKVKTFVKDANQYKNFLVALLNQSLQVIEAKDAVVYCRAADNAIVQKAIKEVKGTNLSLAKESLPESAWGGLTVQTTDGRIVCDNTLAYRTKQCVGHQLPTIRYSLFNAESSI